MSGHSKFSNIKHKKEKNDAAKGKIFTKLGRELMVAIKEGGPDPEANGKLREVIAKCKSNNMPNDTIQRSIKKAAESGNVDYESCTYEGYGPGGIAVIVECLTDNKTRTAANVRHAFSKCSGNMGTQGCVSFMFDKKGQIVIDMEDGPDEDELTMIAIEAGAEDFVVEDGSAVITTDPDDFDAVYSAIEAAGIAMAEAEITMLPQTTTALTDPEQIENLEKMLDMLEDDDDVQDVYHNWENED